MSVSQLDSEGVSVTPSFGCGPGSLFRASDVVEAL